MTSGEPNGRNWTLRSFRSADTAGCGACYFDAVRNGTSGHYDAAQAAAWAPDDDPSEWAARLSEGTTWIAADGAIVAGFLTLRDDGHLDLFFVRPAYRKVGVSDGLYAACLDHARSLGMERLTTHASLLAKSFLTRRGWVCLQEERSLRNGQSLSRYRMALKSIAP